MCRAPHVLRDDSRQTKKGLFHTDSQEQPNSNQYSVDIQSIKTQNASLNSQPEHKFGCERVLMVRPR